MRLVSYVESHFGHNWYPYSTRRYWKFLAGIRQITWCTIWVRRTRNLDNAICTQWEIPSMMTIESKLKNILNWFSNWVIFVFLFRTEPTCITCDLGEALWSSRYYYSNCSHFDAFLAPKNSVATSSGISFYILDCQGPGLPVSGVHASKTHSLVKVLYDTRLSYTERLKKLALPTQRSFEISLPHGSRAQVQLLLPPSWREELRDAAFPVVVEV